MSSIRYCLYDILAELRNYDFSKSSEAKLSNQPFLLLTGEAGIGKTHLFCDVACKRIEADLPTILLLGQGFTTTEEPWTQILQLLHLSSGTTVDEILGALEAVAQASNTKALILVDALNEGMGRVIWKNHLAAMLTTISHSPWISIGISVRTSYREVIIERDKRLWKLQTQGIC